MKTNNVFTPVTLTAISILVLIGIGLSVNINSDKVTDEKASATSIVTIPSPIPSPLPTKNVLEEEFRIAFIEGCVEGNEANRSYCNCNWEYLMDKYGLARIYEVSVHYEKTNEIPYELMESSQQCINLYKN